MDALQARGRARFAASVLIFAAELLSSASRTANAAATFTLERLTPRLMYMAPGTSASYVLRITNVGDAAGSAPLYAAFYWENRWDPYTLTQSSDPRCGPLHPSIAYPGDWLFPGPGFETAPIAAGDSLDCALTISRTATSPRDTSLEWVVRDTAPPYASVSGPALIGTLADTSIRTRNLDFSIDAQGIARATVELTVHNGGHATVAEQVAGACEDSFIRPFFTDGSGPQGCGDSNFSPLCFDRGYGFLIPQLDAGQTHRCLIHLQSRTRYDKPLQFPIDLDLFQQGIGGGTLIDIDQSNNVATLFLGPMAAGASVPLPAIGWTAMWILVASLVVMARRRHRRDAR